MAIQTVNVGTTPGDDTGDPARTAFIKLNSNFTDTTNAASRLVGTLPDQVPTNSLLYAIPRVINFTNATGTVSLDSLNLAIGDRALVRKLNATQGTVTITCTGHTFTRAALASVSLNSDGDFWLVEKVSATRLDLIDGSSSGSNASGEWIRFFNGSQECRRIFLSLPSPGTGVTLTTDWTFPISFYTNPVLTIAILTPAPETYSGVSATTVSATQGSICTRRTNSTIHEFNTIANGKWYE